MSTSIYFQMDLHRPDAGDYITYETESTGPREAKVTQLIDGGFVMEARNNKPLLVTYNRPWAENESCELGVWVLQPTRKSEKTRQITHISNHFGYENRFNSPWRYRRRQEYMSPDDGQLKLNV